MTIYDLITYLFSQTSETIFRLKTEAYRATEHEKYAYRSPDGKSFRNERPSEQLMSDGWTYGKVKFVRGLSFMSPKHQAWPTYRQAKHRANVLMAACLILKANHGLVPEKGEVGELIDVGILVSQARHRTQKPLGFVAYRLLKRLINKLEKDPDRFKEAAAWKQQRREGETANV